MQRRDEMRTMKKLAKTLFVAVAVVLTTTAPAWAGSINAI
jgi:hypothetical protein